MARRSVCNTTLWFIFRFYFFLFFFVPDVFLRGSVKRPRNRSGLVVLCSAYTRLALLTPAVHSRDVTAGKKYNNIRKKPPEYNEIIYYTYEPPPVRIQTVINTQTRARTLIITIRVRYTSRRVNY